MNKIQKISNSVIFAFQSKGKQLQQWVKAVGGNAVWPNGWWLRAVLMRVSALHHSGNKCRVAATDIWSSAPMTEPGWSPVESVRTVHPYGWPYTTGVLPVSCDKGPHTLGFSMPMQGMLEPSPSKLESGKGPLMDCALLVCIWKWC